MKKTVLMLAGCLGFTALAAGTARPTRSASWTSATGPIPNSSARRGGSGRRCTNGAARTHGEGGIMTVADIPAVDRLLKREFKAHASPGSK